MKKIYFLFLLALLPIAVYADAVEIDGIYYDLNAENNTAEVKSNPNKYSGSVVIPSKVTYENNTYDVTSIGDIAFYECTELISISIPNGITSIGFNAFYRCYKLSSINIPNTVTSICAEAFWWCGELTSVTIPNGITTIEPDVFRDSGLNSIEIPSSVTYISSDAFNDSFLTSVTIPNSVTGIGEKAFYKCDKMEDIYSYIQEPFAVNENAFPTNNGTTILHVPAGTKSAYLNTAGWSKFGESNIVEFTISSGQVDGIYYQFSESEASVKSNPQKYTGSVTIPSSVKHQGKTYNVTSISDNAFESCFGLTSVVIPNSVTSIGKEAFEGCSSLAEINIPDGVTSIAHQTFKNCNSLTAIVIPENVTGIAYEAFKGCSELTAITIPNSVRRIGNEAFEGCSSLTEINIPTGITSIGDQTFHDCSSLTAITIPDGVTSIGEEAFKGCLSITSITIPKSVATIKTSAFNQCPGLTMLNVEFGNTKYDSRGNCNAIINTETNSLIFGTKNTIIPHDVSSIGDYAFYDCTSLTSITIPNSVTSIGYIAFHGCTGLTSITIPSSVTSIGNNAFQSCTGLASITIPSSITSIGANVFYKCTGLTSITIPNSVTSITSGAFEDCSSLTSVTVERDTPEAISGSVFTNRANATLYVPTGAKAAYQAADYWKEFKEIIEMKAEGPVRVINVTTAGTLSSLISDEDKFNITDLTITGQLNGTDFRLLRAMAGNDYTGHPTEGKLEKLDLSGATIVEGGDPYFVSDGIYRADGSIVAGKGSQSLSTGNNVVGPFLFAGCTQLSEVKIPTSTKEIGDWAFMMTNISALDIPEGVVRMWASFSYNTRASTITIPSSVTDIMASSWQINPYLSSIIVDSNNSKYDSRNNCNAIIEKSTNTLVLGCKNTIIPNDTKIIGSYAFSGDIGESITLPQGLLTIKQSAFNSSSIKNIAIPASVSLIEDEAFVSCYNLATITVDASNATYESPEGSNAIIEKSTKTLIAGCKSTIIPSGVKVIGARVFNSCNSMASITIPASIESIGDYAFGYCNNLTSVTVEAVEPLAINETVFSGTNTNATLYVPAGSKAKYAAATGWKNFGTILEGNEGSAFTAKTTEGWDMVFTVLDESAKTCQVGYLDGSFDKPAIDRDAVEGTVTIPGLINGYTVVKIGKYAFDNAVKMTSVTIPESVTTIDDYAFYNCNGLTSFELPVNVTYLGNNALSSLRSVTSLKVAEGNTKYDSRGNCNAIIETTTNKLLFGSKITTIPADVPEIGEYAFHNLADYTLTLPSTVTKIDDNAFYFCAAWTLQVEHTTPLVINENVFGDMSNSTLRVPAGSKSAYAEATGWSKFGTDNIVEEKKISINVETAGTLSSKISDEDKFNITDLTITGQLNGTDFRLLREMAGNDYTGHPTEGKLQKLDLSGATIVKGGDLYFVSDGIYRDGFIVEVLGSQSHSTGNNVVGPFLFAGCTQLSEVKIPASTTEIGPKAFMMTNISALDIPEGVEKLWASFSYNTHVSTITIPSSVMEIGDSWGTYPYLSSIVVASDNSKYDSRNNCNAIMEKSTNTLVLGCKNTIIPDDTKIIGSYAFSGDIAESITLPQGLQAIKNCAFFSSSIKNIAIPASVSLIEDWAFGYCNNLATITVDASNETYESPEGSNAIIEKSTKTLIAGCKSTIIPSGVKKISAYLFHNWYSLTSITIPASIEAIGDCAFDNCKNLTSVTVEAVEPLAISETVFSGTSTNATLYVPAGSKTAYQAADYWKEFKEIVEVEAPSGNIVFASNAVKEACVKRWDTNSDGELSYTEAAAVTSFTNFSAGDSEFSFDEFQYFTGVTSLSNNSFSNRENLTSIILPSSITSIGREAFWGSKITSINLGDLSNLTTIGTQAFYNCYRLTEVTLPASITTMGSNVFANCYNIVKVVSNIAVPLPNSGENNIIAIYNDAVLYVPTGKADLYEAAGWKESDGELQSFRVITEGNSTDPVAREGLVYGGGDIWMGGNTQGQRLIYPGTYREGMMEYSLDGSTYSTSVPTGKDAGEYTVYYRKVGESVASTLQVTIALSGNIVFASDKVKAACVAKWDTDDDKQLSYAEARAVTCLIEDPRNSDDDPFAQLWVEDSEFSFDEFQYFTGVTSLTGYEFADCENLTSIILPNSITSIGDGAFSGCKKLTSIHIPASVTYIPTGEEETVPAFISSYLQTITVDPENTKYASPVGSNVIIDTENNTLILGCGNTDFTKVPNTVTTIGRDAFSGVTFVNTIVSLPISVKGIMEYAFMHSNITSINLGELSNLTTIGNEAFSYCKGLTEVTLPASITRKRTNEDEEGIGISVFANCDNIVKVVSNIAEPLDNSGDNCSIIAIQNDAVLYVPEGKKQDYIVKGWEEFYEILNLKSFRVITDGNSTDPEAIDGLVYNGSNQKLILPGTYRIGMMEYSLDGSTYSTSVPTGKEAGEYTVYYRKVGLSDASILKVTIAAPQTISVFSGSNLWAGYVAAEDLALPTGLEAYVITNLGATTATASSLNYIPQGVPVLLKRNNASVNDYEISTGSGTAPTVNLLKTYDSDKSVSNREGFILYNDEFVLVNEGTLPAGRLFLPANGSGRALTRTIVFDRDDIVDFGDSQENNDDSNQWYDIQGRKLERKPTKKGIYILDGRKVVIK